MNTIHYNDTVQLPPCVATIGFFDGVHRGHQFLIHHLVETARKDGLQSTVITFDAHPRKVLQADYQPEMLSTLDSKLLLLSKTEVDNAVVLHFDKAMAAMSAREFMQQVLHDHLNVRKLFIGYDHRFGHNREETFEDYVRYGKEMGIEVIRNEAFQIDGINISSSVIRSFLKEGEVEMAARCLGFPYTLIGKVVNGFHEGRKLGFPTANLDISHFGQLIPAPGVYAVRVRLENTVVWKRGMMNVGNRPTFNGRLLTLETHIFNFDGDIYDQLLLVSFVKRIRGEQKFDSPEGVVVGVGNIDAHAGAVGAGIRCGTVVLNLGTSACHMALMPSDEMGGRLVEGIFGQVDSSIVPGMVGFEAGLSAFGDVYAWFRNLLCWPLEELLVQPGAPDAQARQRLAEECRDKIMGRLAEEAERLELRDRKSVV